MNPWLQDPDVTVWHGDCLTIMAQLPEASVDAVVTDPPAGIAFMGREWDGNRGGRDSWVAWLTQVMAECLRVLKPGGHALVWALPRTSHWTGWAIEEAGFEVRDRVTHLTGQGFPKSLDVSKAIDEHFFQEWLRAHPAERERLAAAGAAIPEAENPDAARATYDALEARLRREAGAEREVVGSKLGLPGYSLADNPGAGVAMEGNLDGSLRNPEAECVITAPATPEAAAWQGWGTALKPAAEDWWLARKPLAERTVACQVLATGTGAINVDGCRIDLNDETWDGNERNAHEDYSGQVYGEFGKQYAKPSNPAGRWPANVTLDEAAAALLDEAVGERPSGARAAGVRTGLGYHGADGDGGPAIESNGGGPSRFFKVTRPDEQEGECPCPTSPASTAEGCSPPPSASADSAPSDAATLGSPEARSGSERAASSPCPASTPSQSDSIPIPNHARDAVSPANIGITPTTPDRRPSSGSVTDATDGSTVGADVVNDDALNVSPSGFNRAFYTAKASAEEREGSRHPTIKPLDLMRWLVRMVTPPGVTFCPACEIEYEDHAAPKRASELRNVRSGVHGRGCGDEDQAPRTALLLFDVPQSPHGCESRDDPGIRDRREGLPLDPGAEPSDGIARGLRDGASTSDGRGTRADADAGRDRPSPERDQGRQPPGEPDRAVEAGPRPDFEASAEADHLSSLRRSDQGLGSCSTCGADLASRPGTVLDPFAGSGTTGLACRQEGVRAILIEREAEYLPDIANRLRQLSLFGDA